MEGFTDEYCEIWPDWGTMRAGECYPLSMPARYTGANAYLLLPTPMASDGRVWMMIRQSNVIKTISLALNQQKQLRTIYYLQLCGYSASRAADFTETMMGFPKRWTDLNAAETP